MKRVLELLSEAESASRGSGEEIDAGYFASAAEKLKAGQPLSENEADVVNDEIENELLKLDDHRENFGPLSKEDAAYRRELNSVQRRIRSAVPPCDEQHDRTEADHAAATTEGRREREQEAKLAEYKPAGHDHGIPF